MAYKSFRSLTPRNQSNLITQLHKLINYYGEIFCPRERSYLKTLSQNDGSVYWLEDDLKRIIAVAIIDPNYTVSIDPFDIVILGHTISKRPGQMDRILHHIWSDYQDKTIAVVCRKTLSTAFDVQEFQLVEMTNTEIAEYWPELAEYRTNYFNLTNEKMIDGLIRKDYTLFMKFTPQDLSAIRLTMPKLYELISKKMLRLQDTQLSM